MIFHRTNKVTSLKAGIESLLLLIFASVISLTVVAASSPQMQMPIPFTFPASTKLDQSQEEAIKNLSRALASHDRELSARLLNQMFSRKQWRNQRDETYLQLIKINDIIRQRSDFDMLEQLSLHFNGFQTSADQETLLLYVYASMGNYFFFSKYQQGYQLFQPVLGLMSRLAPTSDSGVHMLATCWFYYAQILNRKNREEEALSTLFKAENIYKNANKNHPKLFRIYGIIGETYLQIKKYQLAEKYIRMGIDNFSSDRKDGRGYFAALLADSLHFQNKNRQALQVLEQYFKNPVDQRADFRLYIYQVYIRCLTASGEYKKATKEATDALTLAVEHGNAEIIITAKFQLAKLLHLSGQSKKSEKMLREAIDRESAVQTLRNPDIYLLLVTILKEKGDYQGALDIFQQYNEAADRKNTSVNQAQIRDLEISRRFQQIEEKERQRNLELQLTKEREKYSRELLNWLSVAVILMLLLLVILGWLLNVIRRAKRQFETLSNEDPLTRLKNRRFIDGFMERELPRLRRASEQVSVLLVDIDYFKRINDSYDHKMGDQVLTEFSRLLENITRKEDVIGRWGGEEFLLICRHGNENALLSKCRDIRSALKNTKFCNGAIKLTISMGGGLFPATEAENQLKSADSWRKEWQSFLNQIDHLLYQVKKNGRDNWRILER